MILPLKKIVEEFYLNTSRFKNINQSIVIKYRTNYSVATINCLNLDKKCFFHTVSCFTNNSDFCKHLCLQKGLQMTFEYFDGEKSI